MDFSMDRRVALGAAAALATVAVPATTTIPAMASPGVGSRPMRIAVAAKDAPAYIKAEANYVCTGANDQTTINAAIAEAATGPIAGSSERALNAVELSGGQFYCSCCVRASMCWAPVPSPRCCARSTSPPSPARVRAWAW
jgi:hypothetical protein